MPSTWPARPPACRRTRSPTRNGRAEISTMPAIRLPSVCWAARPTTTAVTAPPTASVRGVRPAIRSAISAARTRNDRRIRKPTVPAVPGPCGGRARLHQAPEVARERPAEHDQHDRRGDAHGRVDAEDLLAEDVGDDRRDVSGTISSSSRRARRAALQRVQRDRARPGGGRLGVEAGFVADEWHVPQATLPARRGFHLLGLCDQATRRTGRVGRTGCADQNRLVWRTGSGFGGASAGGGRSKRGGVSRPLRRRPGSRASSSLRAPGCRYAPLR